MMVTVNGEATEVAGVRLAEILAELGFANLVVATAVNARFVPKDRRAEAMVAPGDTIEILAPRQGG